MKTLEVDEILRILEKCGWQAWLCDTPVPVYESVHAGDPADPGQIPPDMMLMPKAFVKACQDSMVKVCGNSMTDVGIHDGDLVKMTVGGTPRDGDIVVVAIGSDCTVKCYHEDDNGVCWLLPQNKAESGKYKAIRLDEEISEPVHLCGVVTDLMNPLPRISGRKMRSTLAELRPQEDEKPKISDERVDAVIRLLAQDIKIARMWYAVCRSMVDATVYGNNDFDLFCARLRRVVPRHQHLPRPDEIQRVAVGCFAKPVSKWNELNAPVRGKRYQAYRALADRTTELLTMKDNEFRLL